MQSVNVVGWTGFLILQCTPTQNTNDTTAIPPIALQPTHPLLSSTIGTASISPCNHMWLKRANVVVVSCSMNDLFYARLALDSLSIQRHVTFLCGGNYFKVNEELEGHNPQTNMLLYVDVLLWNYNMYHTINVALSGAIKDASSHPDSLRYNFIKAKPFRSMEFSKWEKALAAALP